MDNNRIGIIGYSGFVGSAVFDYFNTNYVVYKIDYRDFSSADIRSNDIILNFAGYSISNYWNKKNKLKIIDSRVNLLQRLYDYLNKSGINLHAFISVSAIGLYDGNDCYDECNYKLGNNFLAQLVLRWEEKMNAMKCVSQNVAILRLGIVIGNKGFLPAIEKTLPFHFFIIPGSRDVKYSLISVYDIPRIIETILQQSKFEVFNLVSSSVFTLRDFEKQYRKTNKIKFSLILRPVFIKLIFGEQSVLFLKNTIARSTLKERLNYVCKIDTIEDYLDRNR